MSSISNLRQTTSLLEKCERLMEGNTIVGHIRGARYGWEIHCQIQQLRLKLQQIQDEYDGEEK